MAVVYATLAKELDGKVEYVYPKTIADMVEYDTSDSVKSKIEKIDGNINEINDRITKIVTGIDYGSLGTYNDAELIDIRTPNRNLVPEGTDFESAGNAIRGQFEAVISLIDDVKSDIDSIKDNSDVESIRQHFEELDGTVNEIKSNITALQNTHSSEIKSIQENNSKIEETVNGLKKNLEELSVLSEDMNNFKTQLNELTQIVNNTKTSMDNLQKSHTSDMKTLADAVSNIEDGQVAQASVIEELGKTTASIQEELSDKASTLYVVTAIESAIETAILSSY